ncbi:MAG: hypothetical protein Harvfovirus1_85 [Harvfovirus sp.]|uniref:Uncharacterized protein n=1 Tax=Harvfovirus sp. TaxID=2487768 RepID=A0A3G5A009_9VIRU|nr:MAG: hypothetical protein Harvfovirus1_85 [Harvfovirus sp.]
MQIKLEGFRILLHRVNGEDATYLLPVYSFICECNIKIYLMDMDLCIFRPKYYKKYNELREEKLSLAEYEKRMPCVSLTPDEKKGCKTHPRVDCWTITGYNPAVIYLEKIYYQPQTSQCWDELYESLKIAENFEIYWISAFAIDYWATCQYGWFQGGTVNFNLTRQGKEKFMLNARETKFLGRIQMEMDKLQTEVYGELTRYDVIKPLVNIVCEYSNSPLHTMGKIIEQLKHDIVKYT